MKKFIVIDSLARSGTTLLASLMRSQHKSAIFCPGFNESLCVKGLENLVWANGYARHPILPKNSDININKYKKNSLNLIKKFNQLYGKPIEDYEKIIKEGKTPTEIITNISNFLNVDILGFRWNQGLLYFNNWMVSPNRYWVTIIRNPLDRAISSHKKHSSPYEDSLKNCIKYTKNLEKIKNNDNFILIYYEDLVKNPEKTLRYIYEKMSVTLPQIETENIYGSNNKIFIPQRSEMKTEKKDGYHVGKKYNGIYNDKVNIYQNKMSQKYIDKFKDSLSFSEIYGYYNL